MGSISILAGNLSGAMSIVSFELIIESNLFNIFQRVQHMFISLLKYTKKRKITLRKPPFPNVYSKTTKFYNSVIFFSLSLLFVSLTYLNLENPKCYPVLKLFEFLRPLKINNIPAAETHDIYIICFKSSTNIRKVDNQESAVPADVNHLSPRTNHERYELM